MAFRNLEKAFDCVPRKVTWWALRKLGVEEWIVPLVQGVTLMREAGYVLARVSAKSLR